MKITDLFPTLAAFTGYAPGVDTSLSLNDMQAAFNTACKRIQSVLTVPVFNVVVGMTDEDSIIEPLRIATANMTLNIQLVFDAVNRRKNDVDVYKYELEAMKRSYTENYYAAIDTLLTAIMQATADSELGKAWKDSRYQKLIESCRIRTADDFDAIYPIDGSQLFFFRTLPIQKEVIDSRMEPYFEKSADNDRVVDMLHLVLAKKVVAIALRRFDILECPATIRNLFDDSTVSGQRKDEREQAQALADQLDQESDQLLETIDTLLTADIHLDVSSMSAYNTPEDNIVMMP